MHDDLVLGGPGFWALVVFMYACGGLALFVVIDSLRARRAATFADNPAAKWYWAVPQAIYFAMFVSGNIPGLALPAVATAFVIATPVAFVAQIVYLLRVVYPSPARLAERRLADELRRIGEERAADEHADASAGGE